MTERYAPGALAQQVKRSGALRLGSAVLAVVALGSVLQFGSPLWRRAGLVPVAQRFVALSFPHPRDLPAHLGPGRRLVFSFDVANYTGAAIVQPWRASAVGTDGGTFLIRSGTVAVPAGGTRSVKVSVRAPRHISPALVEVGLPGRHLAPVEFHLTPVPSRAPVASTSTRAHAASPFEVPPGAGGQ